MYACLHVFRRTDTFQLYELALQFSPATERTNATTVVFSIAPLRKLLGSPHQIASEISRAGFERKIQANLAITSDPDTAILLALNFTGVTLVTPGDEKLKLGAIPLSAVISQKMPEEEALLEILRRWGVKTCGELTALPERSVAERLGPQGVYLRNLASGRIQRPLQVTAPPTSYQERLELEHRLELLEPLHRPDAFAMHPLPALSSAQTSLEAQRTRLRAAGQERNSLALWVARSTPRPFCACFSEETAEETGVLRLAVRLFRPALPARVRVVEYAPRDILASSVKGQVLQAAGPWKTSGEWWTSTFWCREEWDIALDDGALYRIYQEAQSGSWFVHGVYDDGPEY